MVFKSFIRKFNVFVAFSAYTCKNGDGEADSEKQLSGTYTKENCIGAVREQHPTANGATMHTDADGNGEAICFAEFKMTGWRPNSNYQSCMFKNETTTSTSK